MDMQKIGKFLAELRKEANLTQEELGEQIGVTNKTVSRWENGNYLPPVEMLQILSAKYGVSINEILSGERLDGESYKAKAEENIAGTLKNSAYNLKGKHEYYEKKWMKDHLPEFIIELILMVAFGVISAIFCKILYIVLSFVGLVWLLWMGRRLDKYLEKHIYGEATPPTDDEIKGVNGHGTN